MGFKQDLFSQFARIGKAFASGRRLELIELLAQGERSVELLAESSGLSVANTSQHLQILKQAGLVKTRREGQRIFYRLSDADAVVQLFDAIQVLAVDQVAEAQQLVNENLQSKDPLEAVSAMDLVERIRNGDTLLLDVRPPEEFSAGHLAGAVNVPLPELNAFLEDLPTDREVVTYCRGPYCVLAYDAVARMRDAGYQARRLEGGYPEWAAAGLPVEP
ncbi:metalloregulator ArsR/SmtB family transcription factor [Thioalkalivibrio sp. ALJ7]|uniref:metalloregulator ArsR/SmtB family transcription factor n=1 Tax=Thioalkalivibrio sp. ALJ7 TaxID=1158756 RepID=UPI000363D596|nr:metalloregulator ArsR/SmtB family transcription factor [Thioalkalivibrio sp. ALJ7]